MDSVQWTFYFTGTALLGSGIKRGGISVGELPQRRLGWEESTNRNAAGRLVFNAVRGSQRCSIAFPSNVKDCTYGRSGPT